MLVDIAAKRLRGKMPYIIRGNIEMKKLPLGIQNFHEIIDGGYVYVDKTRYVYDLLKGTKYYFLSRPRRFGKSLLLDTISEAFSGDKELFKGLWIYDTDYAFEQHPVIRLDMNNISNKTPEVLERSILNDLSMRSEKEEKKVPDNNPGSHASPGDAFKRLIVGLHSKYNKKVVVLIDEYDKPILDHLSNPDIAEANRQVLRGFFGILKSMDPHLRFSMITGVSKFTKTSVFSDLNNLFDITMADEYAEICGIPVGCLEKYFGEHMEALNAQRRFPGIANIHDEILAWYDGYSWDGDSKVFNPFSLLSFFVRKKFESFWYSSGSPKFLIDLIKSKPESFLSLTNLRIRERMLDNFEIRNMEIEPLLFQTGYLTVKEILNKGVLPQYVLEIPNFEVRDAFNLQILTAFTESGDVRAEQAQMDIRDALIAGDLQLMLAKLRGLFASIPYELHVNREAYYHSIFFAVMTVLGFDIDAEVSTSRGRVDAVLELSDRVYVMEFKYVDCPIDANDEKKRALFNAALDEATSQIVDNGYSKKYNGSGKTVSHAAFAFLSRDEIDMRIITFPQ
jgi:hypothetical protein